ncbi:RING finger and transmembrane domain-containing protein 2-like isoform X2 [Durio zibethinus]|uniref:RING finger and transmembrane domain-containing protein 2-like isoform X2 n=1 Tax=Durio zibethinus TaxID=66656 RepID=A0A6P5XNT1_DURZI|nr:RING finger and transmembrane domain-containing protein 2-like isoform X2 [Durio zibethinus]
MDVYSTNSGNNSARYGREMASTSFIQTPFAAILEYSGLLGSSSASASAAIANDHSHAQSAHQEVSIGIIGVGPGENQDSISVDLAEQGAGLTDVGVSSEIANLNVESGYVVHCLARWIGHILPFFLLLLLVFIRQHLQGFFAAIWIAALIFKSNDILQKQAALKEQRRIYVLLSIAISLMLHVISVYWWYRNDDLLYPLIFLPPKQIPPFWHSIFIIMVNDVMVQQTAMAFKCVLLIHYKNSEGHSYRKQGQMLTLVEYFLLLYRTLLPTPVWYRFFLDKKYGSFFSSLTTGLYLTFKLTSSIEKVQLFFAASRVLSNPEVHYGSRATSEQVKAAGDLCAICQEKMHAPILLRCKHIFCEDCVSEWFERERTCPLCRRLVKPDGIRSYADGSTNLAFQLF